MAVNHGLEYLPVFFLVLARILPVSLISPALGARLLHSRVRIVLCIVLAFCILPSVEPDIGSCFFTNLIFQLILGTMIGFVSAIPFYAVQCAGEWLDLNRGESIVSVMVPHVSSRTSSSGRLFLLLATVVFFASDAHHEMIRGLTASFQIFKLDAPLSGVMMDVSQSDWILLLIRRAADLFKISVQLSFPIVFILWMIDVFLGYLNRLAPALQVFYLGLPLKLWVGVLLIAVFLDQIIQKITEVLMPGWMFGA